MSLFKTKNPMFQKISQLLKKNGYRFDIQEAYFVIGTKASPENQLLLLKMLEDNNFADAIQLSPYDVETENLELFIFRDVKNRSFSLLIMDHYEPYHPEELLDIRELKGSSFHIPINSKVIFP